MEMKYIVIGKDTEELMFTFPNEIWHSMFYDTIQSVKDVAGNNWERKYRGWECIAAGFIVIDIDLPNMVVCLGRSESIGVKSRGAVDAQLFSEQQGHKKC